MDIIDAHIHFSRIDSFIRTAADISHVDYSAEGFTRTCDKNRVVAAIGMGLTETAPGSFPDENALSPMLLDLANPWPDRLFGCAGINPIDLLARGSEAIAELRHALHNPRIVGIKIYAGYYPFFTSDAVYDPVYALAAEFALPIVIHGGVTYSDRGLLKYSHPLSFDEVMVTHRELMFVICHMGEPWVMDTAALISKNPNVVTDLSGLLVTDAATLSRKASEPEELLRWRQPMIFEDRYDRFLYGSDWPLAPMEAYISFIQKLVPEQYHGDVFCRNALRVFPRLVRQLSIIQV